MISAHVESLAVLDELKVHFPAHWRELALNQDQVPLDPEMSIYHAREAAGELLVVTIRENGALQGYFLGFIAPGLHYRTCLTLTMDLFWLHPSLRDEDSLGAVERELACDVLFAEVKREAQRRGVKRAFYGSKVHRDASQMFERMGMTEVERYYSVFWG